MKMNDKMKVVICGGLAIVLCLIAYSCGKNNNETIEEIETEQKQEIQVEEQEELETQEVEEQEIQDESLNEEIRNGEYQLEDTDSDVRLIETLAEENFGKNGYDYKVFKQDNMIVLQIKLDNNTLASGQYNMSSWNTLVDTMVRLSGSASGVTSCKFVVSVTDYSDNCYITAMDGVLYIDVFNGINKLN